MGVRNQHAHLAPQQQRVALPPQQMQNLRDIQQHGAHMRQGQALTQQRQQVMKFLAKPGFTTPQRAHLQNKLNVLNQQIDAHRSGQTDPAAGGRSNHQEAAAMAARFPSVPTNMPSMNTNHQEAAAMAARFPSVPTNTPSMSSNHQEAAAMAARFPSVPTHTPSMSSNHQEAAAMAARFPSVPTNMPSMSSNHREAAAMAARFPSVPTNMPSMSSNHQEAAAMAARFPSVPTHTPHVRTPHHAGVNLPRSAPMPQLTSRSELMGSAPFRRPASQPQVQQRQAAPADAARARNYMSGLSPQAIANQLRKMDPSCPLPPPGQLKANMGAFLKMTEQHGMNPMEVIKKDPGIFLQALTGKEYPAGPPTSAAARHWLNQMGGAQNLSFATNWNQQKLESLAGALRQEGKNATVNPSGNFNQNWEAVWSVMKDDAAKTGKTPQQSFQEFVTQKPEKFLEVMNRSGGGSGDSFTLPDLPEVPTNIPQIRSPEPKRAAPRRQAVAG
jgi:hypothetical protein